MNGHLPCAVLFPTFTGNTHAETPSWLRDWNVHKKEICVHRSRIYSITNDTNPTTIRNGGFNNGVESGSPGTTIPSMPLGAVRHQRATRCLLSFGRGDEFINPCLCVWEM